MNESLLQAKHVALVAGVILTISSLGTGCDVKPPSNASSAAQVGGDDEAFDSGKKAKKDKEDDSDENGGYGPLPEGGGPTDTYYQGAPTTKKPIKLVPAGTRWGSHRKAVNELVDKFVNLELKEEFSANLSGPALRDLEAKKRDRKAAFRRSYIDVKGPSGLDSGPIAGEFTIGNSETIATLERGKGVRLWFFFIRGRLWKTFELVELVKGGLYGKDIMAASKMILDTVGGTMPRQTEADPAKKRYFATLDWQDGKTHMRMWDMGGKLAIVREDKATLSMLGRLRTNHYKKKDNMDPEIKRILEEKRKNGGGGAKINGK